MARIIGFAGGAFVNVDQGGGAGDRITIGVNAGVIALKTSAETLRLTFDFSDVLEGAVTLASVTYTVPSGINGSGEATDTGDGTSDIDIDAGSHGAMYHLQVVGTLSDASTVTRTWPIRVFNS